MIALKRGLTPELTVQILQMKQDGVITTREARELMVSEDGGGVGGPYVTQSSIPNYIPQGTAGGGGRSASVV